MAKPDYEVTIGTRHGQLRFLPELFAVKPGSQVKLTLENSDEMIHNLVVAKGDAKEVNRLADMALKLGEKGMEMGFVPDDPAVLGSIGLAQPGESLSTEFRAPSDLGDYPFVCTFPGHSLTMRGVMKVVEDPSSVSVSEEDFVAEGTTPKMGFWRWERATGGSGARCGSGFGAIDRSGFAGWVQLFVRCGEADGAHGVDGRFPKRLPRPQESGWGTVFDSR